MLIRDQVFGPNYMSYQHIMISEVSAFGADKDFQNNVISTHFDISVNICN